MSFADQAKIADALRRIQELEKQVAEILSRFNSIEYRKLSLRKNDERNRTPDNR